MRVITVFYLLMTVAQAMPINFSFPNSKGHASICRYCLCDRHTATVSCAGGHLHIRVISLPSWAETFQAHNLTLTDLPHFTYHSALRVLRINFCQLRFVHPLALLPLPNLETIHLADNLLETLPEAFLQRATRLKILNLARNKIEDLRELEWSLPEGLILEQLVLDGNPLLFGTDQNHPYPWPLARQLHMADTGIKSISSTGLVFKHRSDKSQHIGANDANATAERSLFLSDNVWKSMELLDLSNNYHMQVELSALPKLSNLTTLKLSQSMLQFEMLRWIESPDTKCRHLDLRDANITIPAQSGSTMAHFGGYHGSISTRQWTFCSPNLEWLDVSGTGIDALYVPSYCRVKWLFASRNELESVRVQSGTLKTLELDHNRLRNWPLDGGNQIIPGDFGAPFSPFKQLESVSLANNSLESLPEDWLSWLPALQHLDLSQNKILSLFHSHDESRASKVNTQLRYLNLSANSLRIFPGVAAPDLNSLIVLDLSANSLHSIGYDLFIKMPELQHLHLNDNPNLGSSLTNDDQEWLTNADDSPLRELDMSNCGLLRVPDVSRFHRLTSLRLNSNYLSVMNDANQLPQCISEIEVRDNRIQTLGNMSEAQTKCLKNLDLGLNPLICDCSLVQFAAVLQQQHSIEDRSEYYCFADDWQHSLKAYLEGSADFCEAIAKKSNVGLRYITALLVNVLGIVSMLVGGAALIAFVVLKLSNLVGYRFIPFGYKPVSQTEAPVSV